MKTRIPIQLITSLVTIAALIVAAYLMWQTANIQREANETLVAANKATIVTSKAIIATMILMYPVDWVIETEDGNMMLSGDIKNEEAALRVASEFKELHKPGDPGYEKALARARQKP